MLVTLHLPLKKMCVLFLQEREYLRHIVARIANLQPDLVLVHRNVSRLAQEFLLALRVTLVLNVKASVLERVARCTQADIVTSVDAHVGRPQLGTCRRFYLKTFQSEKGVYLKVYVLFRAYVCITWMNLKVLDAHSGSIFRYILTHTHTHIHAYRRLTFNM